MKLFKCQSCGQVLYFENRVCQRCGHTLGFLAEDLALTALESVDPGTWTALARTDRPYRFCANAAFDVCNWIVPADGADRLCRACRHNAVIPDTSLSANVNAWRVIEMAKHRLFYTLLRLRLPLATRQEDPQHGLSFEFLADPPASSSRVMTGHDNGVITIALAEADDVERERRRTGMGEPYRTLLGHFRHEIGHYYWDVLVRDGGPLDTFRSLFGDDRADYGEALQRHYAQGAPADWSQRFVSAYASAHPWEDFAETWSHYLHIVDTLEMARAFGLSVNPKVDDDGLVTADLATDPRLAPDFARIVDDWLPLTFALNNLNRCMGQADVYPFIISPPVVEKLDFVHGLLRGRGRGRSQATSTSGPGAISASA